MELRLLARGILHCEGQILSLANLSQDKQCVGRSMEWVTEREEASAALKVKDTELKDDLFLMLLSGWVHSSHLPCLSRGVRI